MQTQNTTTKPGGVVVGFKTVGNPAIGNQLSRMFYDELRTLIMRSGFAGRFTIVVRTKVKGTTHTRGLRVGSPEIHGVAITWHEGSNDNRIEMLLCRPGDMDSFGFHARLVKALHDIEGEPQPEKVVRLHMSKSDPAAPVNLPLISTGSGSERFLSDSQNLELFFLEIAPSVLPDGRVLRRTCLDVLNGSFGFRSGGLGRVLASILKRNHLLAVDDEWVRVSAEWLKKIPPVPVEPIFQIVETGGDFLAQLGKLSAIAETMQRHQSRLSVLVDEIAQLDDQIGALQEKRSVIVNEREGIQAQLASPEFGRAMDALELIRKLGSL